MSCGTANAFTSAKLAVHRLILQPDSVWNMFLAMYSAERNAQRHDRQNGIEAAVGYVEASRQLRTSSRGCARDPTRP